MSSFCNEQNTKEYYDLYIFLGSQDLVIQECKKFEAAGPNIAYRMQFFEPNIVLE